MSAALCDEQAARTRAVERYLAALRPGAPGLPAKGADGEWPRWSCGCMVNGTGAHWVACRGPLVIVTVVEPRELEAAA